MTDEQPLHDRRFDRPKTSPSDIQEHGTERGADTAKPKEEQRAHVAPNSKICPPLPSVHCMEAEERRKERDRDQGK